jgi:hypothetical protein
MNFNLNLEITEEEALRILTALLEKYMNSKLYFSECENEEDTIGMTTPEELKATYNNLLKQIRDKGLIMSLDFLK